MLKPLIPVQLWAIKPEHRLHRRRSCGVGFSPGRAEGDTEAVEAGDGSGVLGRVWTPNRAGLFWK